MKEQKIRPIYQKNIEDALYRLITNEHPWMVIAKLDDLEKKVNEAAYPKLGEEE